MKHLVIEQNIHGFSRTSWQDCFIAGSNLYANCADSAGNAAGLEPSARQHA